MSNQSILSDFSELKGKIDKVNPDINDARANHKLNHIRKLTY